LFYVDGSDWSAEDQANAERVQGELGLLKEIKLVAGREHEYPVDHKGRPRGEPSRIQLVRPVPASDLSGVTVRKCQKVAWKIVLQGTNKMSRGALFLRRKSEAHGTFQGRPG
jgi:hypothetical protein